MMADQTERERSPAATNGADAGIELCTVDGREFARVQLDGQTLLLPPKCPHRGAPLSEGRVVGKFVVCGRHGATFDLRTGKWLRGPSCKDIRVVVAAAQQSQQQMIDSSAQEAARRP